MTGGHDTDQAPPADRADPADPGYDVVIVGAGINGALIAKRLTLAGLRVLVLEAGPASAWTFDGYTGHLDRFFTAAAKGPESAWPPAANAPQPDTGDVRRGDGYFVQRGPDQYGSSYTRLLGGSTLHWLGVCLRMLPEDFELRSRYGVGRDWPLGYADLEPYYRQAEWEIGVSADVEEQAHLGIEFPDGYDYPMRRMPPSYSDQVLGAAVDGMEVTLGGRPIALRVRNYPAARNSIPRGDYQPVGAVDERADGLALAADLGQRCAGNTACTPICPIQAKYNAQKTLARADRGNLRVIAQAVASKILVDPVSGQVTGVEYQHYADPGSPRHTRRTVRARGYVLAAHAVENAKLLLASGLGGGTGGSGGADGLVGQGLMDHPALYAWGLSPVPVGAYRGPLSTAGLDDLRGGSFRAQHAAFRFDIGNDGWRAPTGAPDTSVAAAVTSQGLFGERLRQHLETTLPRHVRFSVATEQLWSAANRVTIDPRYTDPLGNPRPVISYRVDEYTLAGMAAATEVYQRMFRRAGIEDATGPASSGWFPAAEYGGRSYHYHGMGHFAGTHVMGARPEDSVVDADQRSWAHPNLFIVGSGSFPSMGTSNPTLTMAALSLRTAERMLKELTQ